jgi:phosphoribosylglycinamide formyltransferase-1
MTVLPRIGVLASGGGTNLQALLDAERGGQLGPGRIVVVGANGPTAGALQRARAAAVDTFVVEHRSFPSREDFDAALVSALRAAHVDWVVLAGFMRILSPTFLTAFPGRVINIHPALLPAFPGVDGQGQALRYGVKFAGCTVHFVDTGVDSGPIIAQAVVPVLDDDDDASLRARILSEEHRLLPAMVRAAVEGRLVLDGRRVRVLAPTR